ncbi:hypothetical protein MRX96_051129 [Rhipicephalus microplus]
MGEIGKVVGAESGCVAGEKRNNYSGKPAHRTRTPGDATTHNQPVSPHQGPDPDLSPGLEPGDYVTRGQGPEADLGPGVGRNSPRGEGRRKRQRSSKENRRRQSRLPHPAKKSRKLVRQPGSLVEQPREHFAEAEKRDLFGGRDSLLEEEDDDLERLTLDNVLGRSPFRATTAAVAAATAAALTRMVAVGTALASFHCQSDAMKAFKAYNGRILNSQPINLTVLTLHFL